MDINKTFAPILKKIETVSLNGCLSDTQKGKLLYYAGGTSIVEGIEDKDIKDAKDTLLGHFELWISILGEGTNKKSLAGNNPLEKKPPRNKGKWFKRQVYLVNFVLNSKYSPQELIASLITGIPLPSKCLKWEKLIVEWNKNNPSDTLLNGEVLKAEFYRCCKNPRVMEEILLKDIEELQLSLQDYKQARIALIEFSQEIANRYKQIANHYEKDFLKREGS